MKKYFIKLAAVSTWFFFNTSNAHAVSTIDEFVSSTNKLFADIFSWITRLAVAVCIVFFAYNSIQYAVSDEEGYRAGKKRNMKNVLIGLIICLVAQMIVETVKGYYFKD